jgi:thiamine pyrophosphate-dependent acetolactate synthase large subunit-like protein
VHPARLVVEATKVFPADGILVRDGGATTIFQWTYSLAKPNDVIWNQNFGHLGTGLPYAVGAGVATGGKRPIMLITGDSSIQFHIAELETAARLNLPLVVVVAVDYAWGLEVGVYKRTFGQESRETGAHWSPATRLDKVAEGFGCHGEFVEREEDIAPAIKRAYASGKPAVIHVLVDPKANSEEMPNYHEYATWAAEGAH